MMLISSSMLLRIVGADLHVEAVFERRNDPAAAGVVFRVGAGDDDDVERQANLVAFDLDVFFFHQVEQADLNFFGQVRQLVDGEDTAVGARHETVMDGFLIGEIAALGDFDRIDFADQIGDRDIRRGELFAVAAVAVDPCESAERRPAPRPSCGNRGRSALRVVVDLATLDDGNALVEQADQAANDARLALAALAEKHHVMAGQE